MTILKGFYTKFSPELKVHFEELKKSLTGTQRRTYLFEGLNCLKTVELSNINHTTSPECKEFRKSLFPGLRFWMRDIKNAGRAGLLSYQEALNIFTFVRAAAVERIAILREKYPAAILNSTFKPRLPIVITETVEVVQCNENGRPLTEVQAEQIAELIAINEKLSESYIELSEASEECNNSLLEAVNVIKSQKVEIKSLNKTIDAKTAQIKSIQKGVQAFNQAIKV